MKLSPLDIQHQEFDTSLSGYNRKQVRDFLARAADQLEDSLRENQSLREEIKKREERIEELQLAELELKRAVVAAERIGNEIKESAKREAGLIVREAEERRTTLLHGAEERLRQATAEISRLEREQRLFREQFRGMLRAYERSLDSLPMAKREKEKKEVSLPAKE